MAAPRTSRKPTFFWQGLLILLPVAVLAVVGVISLRQDKVLARHDAAERAQVIADDLAAKIWNELTAKEPSPLNLSIGPAFEVDQAGQLMFPPAVAPVPLPKPFDLAGLNARQTQLWLRLQSADASQQNSGAVSQAFSDFIGSHPPERFAAAACYGLGLVLAQQGKNAEAAEMFDRVVKKYPEAVGESGLPLQPLAQLKWLQLAIRVPDVAGTNSVSVESLYSNVICQPTLLTPELLRQAEMLPAGTGHEDSQIRSGRRVTWQLLWQNHAAARQLYAAARQHFYARANPAPPSFPLLSTSANYGNQTADDETLRRETGGTVTNISFARLFWFTTPNLLCVPNVPGLSKEPAQNIYRSFVVVTNGFNAFGSIWNSNATTTLARSIAGGGTLDLDWLAIGFDDHETNHWYVCRGESELGHRIAELAAGEKQIPEYFGIGVEVAGKKIRAFAPDLHLWTFRYVGGGKSSGREVRVPLDVLATNVLASAVQPEQLLKVNVYLTSPDKLYQRQGARTFWFGSLVAVSAAAALIGLLAAWRAFRQQRQLSELKSNFVSSVSHELRAPIASVRLMAENLEGNKIPEPQKQKEYFGFIVQECRRLTSLIENVLDFSRIEQGRKQYEFEPTDILALVRTTVKLMEPNAAEKGVRLELETSNIQHPTSNIELEMDGQAIQQALVNLIDNAIKHSPKGETVTVGLEVRGAECGLPSAASGRRMGVRSENALRNLPATTPPASRTRTKGEDEHDAGAFLHPPSSILHPRLALWVQDHGPGIPPAEHARIFERFYRRGSELRRETQGVGIGLSIVKHIVEAHGGRVLVESAVGQGSRFIIELPIRT
jgi:signal transduction histidine kinase